MVYSIWIYMENGAVMFIWFTTLLSLCLVSKMPRMHTMPRPPGHIICFRMVSVYAVILIVLADKRVWRCPMWSVTTPLLHLKLGPYGYVYKCVCIFICCLASRLLWLVTLVGKLYEIHITGSWCCVIWYHCSCAIGEICRHDLVQAWIVNGYVLILILFAIRVRHDCILHLYVCCWYFESNKLLRKNRALL